MKEGSEVMNRIVLTTVLVGVAACGGDPPKPNAPASSAAPAASEAPPPATSGATAPQTKPQETVAEAAPAAPALVRNPGAKPLSFAQARDAGALVLKLAMGKDKKAFSEVVAEVKKNFGEPWESSEREAYWTMKLTAPLCRELSVYPLSEMSQMVIVGGGVAKDQALCKKHKPISAELAQILDKEAREKTTLKDAVQAVSAKAGKPHAQKDKKPVWYWQEGPNELCKGFGIRVDKENPAGFVFVDVPVSPEACK